jgi:Zn-dependent protease with chaperone function
MDSFSASSDSSQMQGEFFAEPEALQSSLSALGRGLKAIKHRDYETAIAQLETVCQSATDEGSLLKAQMGLVVAYARKGERRLAIALCKPLCTHSSEQVKTWAAEMMENLSRVPRSPQPSASEAETQLHPDDQTGFVPMADAETGFVPLEPPPARPQPPKPKPPRRSRPSSPPTLLQTETTLNPATPSETAIAPEPVAADPVPVAPGVQDPPSEPAAPFSPAATVPDPHSELPSKALSTDLADRPLWRNAGRAQRWAALPEPNVTELRIVQVITLAGFIVWVWAIAQVSINLLYSLLQSARITYAPPPSLFLVIAVILGMGMAVFPWVLHWILQRVHGLQPFPVDSLLRRSPEAVRALKRLAAQRRSPLPTLGLLPTAAPLALAYGLIPSQSHIAVSQGLLEQLNDDEIAAVILGEQAHLSNGSAAVLGSVALWVYVPYLLYWRLATWGDRFKQPLISAPLAALASLFYGLFWLMQLPGYWLCRYRQSLSDRQVLSITGNPNGLTRALVKQSVGVSRAIQYQRESVPLLEGLRLLTPLSDRAALPWGSLYSRAALPPLLAWDTSNPYRRWFVLRQSHVPLGERLARLDQCARQWRLPSELDWPMTPRATGRSRSAILLQVSPLLGLPLGLAFALCIWLAGVLAPLIGLYSLAPLWGDRSILWGCGAIGFGFGLFLQINAFFPTIRSYNLQDAPSMAELLSDPATLPLDSHPVKLQGTLLGHRGLRNALEQDLAIKTHQGNFKLRFVSPLGSLGNLWNRSNSPHDHVGKEVIVQGWLRRGVIPWIDVDTLAPQRGRLIRSGHPVWVTLLATLSVAVGLFIILRGA